MDPLLALASSNSQVTARFEVLLRVCLPLFSLSVLRKVSDDENTTSNLNAFVFDRQCTCTVSGRAVCRVAKDGCH